MNIMTTSNPPTKRFSVTLTNLSCIGNPMKLSLKVNMPCYLSSASTFELPLLFFYCRQI